MRKIDWLVLPLFLITREAPPLPSLSGERSEEERKQPAVLEGSWFLGTVVDLPLFYLVCRSTETIQYLDKTALNYAKVFGMEKAMGLHGQQVSSLFPFLRLGSR